MLRTKTGLPKHCSWNVDREDGKRRVRFRWHGFSTYLTGTPWSEEFIRQYAAALDGVKAQASNVGAVFRLDPCANRAKGTAGQVIRKNARLGREEIQKLLTLRSAARRGDIGGERFYVF
jgi:hypothetical protein